MKPTSYFQSDSIFWVDTERIHPNPYQPRRDFDEAKLKDLADSIRQYGILQPLTVTRKETYREDGSFSVEYELIAGERRLRASRLLGLPQVPVIIRSSADDERTKLELAIIENLQREDLNPVDKARAFDRLVKEFGFKHSQIAEKIGKSREYVANAIRILGLPDEIIKALSEGKITEGHTRPLLMLSDRPEEQITVFKEVVYKKLSVREAEAISRRIAYDRVRKKEYMHDPNIVEMEKKLTDAFGTRVQIERKDNGGKIVIDFFTVDDLRSILHVAQSGQKNEGSLMERFIAATLGVGEKKEETPQDQNASEIAPPDDRSKEEKEKGEEEIYSVKNFSI